MNPLFNTLTSMAGSEYPQPPPCMKIRVVLFQFPGVFLHGKAMGLLFLGLLVLVPDLALAQGGYWGMGHGMMGGWGMGWFGGVLMMLFWVLIIVALVFFIRWLVRSSSDSSEKKISQSRALEILKERYARGEIDTQEFEQKRRLLES